MRALIRRGAATGPRSLRVGDLRSTRPPGRAWRGEHELELSAKEFALLELFLRHPDEVLTRTRILEHVWDFAYDARRNVVDQYVLPAPQGRPTVRRRQLETVRGAGYRLRRESEPAAELLAEADTARGPGVTRPVLDTTDSTPFRGARMRLLAVVEVEPGIRLAEEVVSRIDHTAPVGDLSATR